jgi:AraC family L-rhamnose operon regulatory protein RhaS
LPKHQNGGFELHYIAKGHLHWEIEGRPFLVPPDSVFFTFPWETHGSCADFEPGHFFHFAVFRVKEQARIGLKRVKLVSGFGLSEPEQNQMFRKLLSARTRCITAAHDLGWLIARLVRELTHPGVMARTNVIALSQAALCELVKSVHSQPNQTRENSPGEQEVLRFVDKLRLTCSETWTLDTMAAACHLKRTQFEVLTKNLTGDTPSLLLNRFRVRQAQQFLKNSNKSITEIAFDAGFTPTEYRRHQDNLAAYDQRFLTALAQLHK